MQLKDLIKPVEDMTDDELRARLQELRHKREVVRPAAKKHADKAVKKEASKSVKGLSGMLSNMTEEQKAQLIKALGG